MPIRGTLDITKTKNSLIINQMAFRTWISRYIEWYKIFLGSNNIASKFNV